MVGCFSCASAYSSRQISGDSSWKVSQGRPAAPTAAATAEGHFALAFRALVYLASRSLVTGICLCGGSRNLGRSLSTLQGIKMRP